MSKTKALFRPGAEDVEGKLSVYGMPNLSLTATWNTDYSVTPWESNSAVSTASSGQANRIRKVANPSVQTLKFCPGFHSLWLTCINSETVTRFLFWVERKVMAYFSFTACDPRSYLLTNNSFSWRSSSSPTSLKGCRILSPHELTFFFF